jgi:tetratricopeptide (TPR) repeat protein
MRNENHPRRGTLWGCALALLAWGGWLPAQQSTYPEWEKGVECWGKKDFACCAAEFTKVVDLAVRDNSDPSGAYYMAGRCYLAKRDLANAERNFMKVLERTPNSGSTLVQLALIAKQRNENDKAVQLVNQGIGSVTEPADKFLAHKVRGGALLAKSNYAEAAKDLQEALALAPKDGDVLFLLGNAAAGMKQADKAFDYFNRAYAAGPSKERGLALLGAAFKLNKFDAAAKVGQALLDQGVKDATTLTQVGSAHLAVKQYDKAVAALSQIPGATLAKASGLAQAYVGIASWVEAEKYLLEWQKLDSKNPAVYDGLGRVYVKQERQKEALQWYQKGFANTGDAKFKDLAAQVEKQLRELAPAAPAKDEGAKS